MMNWGQLNQLELMAARRLIAGSGIAKALEGDLFPAVLLMLGADAGRAQP